MFLAITRSRLEWEPVGCHRSTLGHWHILAAADPFTRLSISPSSTTLSRSPLTAVGLLANSIGSVISLNASEGTLTLSRSFGAGSALYYTSARSEIRCSTSIADLKSAGISLEENSRHLPEFFVYSYVCPPATLLKGIHSVGAGDELVFKLDGEQWRLSLRRVFQLPELRSQSKAGFDVESRAALEAAMEITTPLKNRMTVLLSGGVDSSILCHIAARNGHRGVTLGASYPFERTDCDIERRYATTAAEALNLQHDHYVPTQRRYLKGLIQTIADTEAPLHGLQTVLLGCAYRDRLGASARVVVNGDGADSVFGTALHKEVFDAGTPFWFERWVGGDILDAALWRLPTWLRRGFLGGIAARRSLVRRLDDSRYFLWGEGRFGDMAWACQRYGVNAPACWETRQALLSQYSHEPLVNQTVLLGLLASVNTLQTLWSRPAEATGRASFYPYTHSAVSDVGLSIPWQHRLREPKQQLKGAARLMGLPAFILERPKAHFGIASDRWAARDGVFEPFVRLVAPIVGEATIRQVQVPAESLARVYWNLINYAIWYRLFIVGETAGQLIEELDEAMAENPAAAVPESN